MFARLLTLCYVVTLLSFASFTLISEANASPGFERETYCVPHADNDVDSWSAEGLGLADLPNTPFWHGWLKSQAWIESGFEPAPINLGDSNSAIGQQSEGMLQIIPMAWYSTPTGKLYPFHPCAFDPALSAAVRAELFSMGWWH